MENLITIPEAAARLGCHPSLLRKRCTDGTIPYLSIGVEYRVRWTDVLAWTKRPTSRLKRATGCKDKGDVFPTIERWLQYLAAVRALAPTTLALYQTVVRGYVRRAAIAGHAINYVPQFFERTTILAVFSQIPATSFNTKQNMHIALSSLGRFLIEENKLQPDALVPLRALKPRRQSEPRRTHLKAIDVQRLFDMLLTHEASPFDNLVFLAMASCMVNAGLRVSEVCNLRVQDVDLIERVIFVHHGKGGKNRRVGIGCLLLEHLQAYVTVRHGSPMFFTDKAGRCFNRSQLARKMRAVSKRLGVDITCHGLRRTFATLAVGRGRPVNAVRIALGHADLSTTQSYLRTAETEVTQEMKGW